MAGETPGTNSEPIPPLLTIADIAAYTKLGARTLRRWLSAGKFPPPDFRYGAKVKRWRQKTVDDFLSAQAAERGGRP